MALRWWSRMPFQRPLGAARVDHAQRSGRRAERRACWHLWLRGWRIVARNWRSGDGELDIVAARWRTLLIVEVRQRPTLDGAWASVDAEKLKRTMRTARRLVERHDLQAYALRLDLIGVDGRGRLARRKDVLRGWVGA
jgi:putative endonuclease